MSVYENLVNRLGFDYEFLPDKPISDIRTISDDTIVCYDQNGNPVYYGMDSWDFKAICPKNETVYNFKLFPKVKDEIKKIIYARLFFSPTARSVTSVKITPINTLAQWASNNSCSIRKMLNDTQLSQLIAVSYSNLTKRSAGVLLSVVRELRKIRIVHPEFLIAPEDDTLGNLLEDTPIRTVDENHSSEQTAVIPSRIYSSLITDFEKELKGFVEHADHLENFYDSLCKSMRKRPNFITEQKNRGLWEVFLDKHNLLEYASINDLRNKKDFNSYLKDIQAMSRYWLHLFSGMRKNEVDTLPYGCIAEITSHGVKTKIIRGDTTKLTSQGATPTFWVTTDLVDVGVEAAQTVARIIAGDSGYTVHDEDFPLFPSWQVKKNRYKGKFKNAPYSESYGKETLKNRVLIRFPNLAVQEMDIRELEMFDGFRDWRSEAPIGQPWPLATHQCRRSLAVYLARSGLVSIGSLQSQFKHLCAAMTSFYKRGATFAINFLDTETEAHRDQLVFVDSIEKEQRIAEYLNFEKNVIEKQASLWGGEGKRIKKAHDSGRPLVIVSDRNQTLERFERGEMVYKESPLGGCTKIGSCNRLSITNITPCIDCEYSVLDETSVPKIERQLAHLESERDQYTPESLFYQHTQNEIDELNRKLRKNGQG
jgi:hypothetical protein